jgi:protein-disulfide isomerase
MDSNKPLFNAVIAASAGAVTAAVITFAMLHVAGLDETLLRRTGAPASPDVAKLQATVHEYLTKNPEILVEMTTELDKRQAQDQDAKQAKAIGDNAEAIFRSKVAHVAGNPNGDVSVVEFFDYNCGYCRRALPDVVKLVEGDGKVRLVLKELPIFGEESEDAAKLAIAADKQGKYFEMHQKLLSEPGKANKDKALKIAKEIGLDTDKLQKDAADPSVTQALAETKELAEKLSLQGTPLYLIGDRVLPGAPDDLYDQLKAKVSEVRKDGCATTC